MRSAAQPERAARARRASVWAVVCGLATASCLAGTDGSAPEGIPVGKVVFAPYVWTSVQFDDNVFRSSNATDDIVNTFGLGTEMIVPIRNSEFALGFEAIKRSYQVNQFNRDVDMDVNADFVLNFSSFDTLTIRNNYYYGFTDVSRRDFDSGDAVFDGLPFQTWSHDIEILRGVSNEKGYYFRASRTTLRYDKDATVQTALFDYDGYNFSGEYRQPFASHKWIVLYGSLRDFESFAPGSNQPDRKEDSSTVQVGLRGMLGRDHPFLVRVGHATFDYKFPNAAPGDPTESTFKGLAVRASLGLAIGGRTAVDFQLDRRALPSNFDTSYTNTRFVTSFYRPVTRNAGVSLDLRYDNNVYNEPIENIPSCNGGAAFSRQDRRYGATANFNWGISNRLDYRMGVAWDSRVSTCDVFSFDSTVFSLGVSSGW